MKPLGADEAKHYGTYVEAGTNIEYAWDLEFGLPENKAHPFIAPIVEQNCARVEALIKEAVSEVLK
ncbi:MAG: hypothetical protein LBI78_07390 [Campylobacteraceae bacterium]|jgi:hypothetical protein|nr:hypothetical protein [Campylobacteraceae bacterium]